MKPATDLIHAGETDLRHRRAVDDADLRDGDVRLRERAGSRRLQRGPVLEVPVFALRQSDGRERRAQAGGARPGRSGAAVLVGHGRDRDDPDGARERRRRGRLQRGDLRRDPAPAERCAEPVRVVARFVSLEELARPEASSATRTRMLWFESPINPTLRCVDIRRLPRPAGHVACCRSSTTRSRARSTSSRSRWASICRCRARRNT